MAKLETVEWNGYILKYNEDRNEWETMWGKYSTVGHKTIAGVKRKISKLEDDAHDAMLNYFSHGGEDVRGRKALL